MTEEIYKSIPILGLENYIISNKCNVINTATKKQLNKNIKMGYYYVSMKKNGETKDKKFRVHIIVAKTFIPNDDMMKKFVNHKNGNKLDNDVSNLEWITPQHNVIHAYENKLIKPFERKVSKYDLEWNLLETYKSIKEAAERCNIDDAGIVKVCKGNRQTAGGFRWKYHEIFDNENIYDISIESMKPIPNFPNYKISLNGKVYSINYKKFLKTQINADGYETVQLQNNGIKQDFLVHRLVATGFIQKTENRNYVNHKNGNKLDNNVENLEWVTNSENMKHYHKEIKSKISSTKLYL